MSFWAELWPVFAGSAAGALVGAVAAWGFAIDLRRRQSRDDYRERLDRAVSELVINLRELTGAVEAFQFNINSPRQQSLATPHIASHRVGSAILVALATANPEERGPIQAVKDLTETSPHSERSDCYPDATEKLSLWRQGELTAEEATNQIRSIKQSPRT